MTQSHPDAGSWDGEIDTYSPMKHTKLISDGDQFFEVPTRPSSPSSFDSSLDAEMDSTSASPVAAAPTPTHGLPNFATTMSSTAPAVVASNLSSLSPAPSALTTRTGGPQPPISQDAARAVIAAYILASAWFESHEMEPRADEAGLPECALLLASPGDSIWACFFKRTRRNGATIFKCEGCQHKTGRLNRAVDHQRAEWGHKPFACADLGCEFRGSTSGSVADHRSTRTVTNPCEVCGKAIMVKNMLRHRLQHCQ